MMRPTLRKRRRGFTLIEILVTVIIAGTLISGFGIMLYDTAEQMHIQWQLRMAEEYGQYILYTFSKKVRNGTGHELLRLTAPSELVVTVIDPWASNPDPELWKFQFDYRSDLPQIRKDGNIQDYAPFGEESDWPPEEPDSRDDFHVDSRSFKIQKWEEDPNVPTGHPVQETYTISFVMTYTRTNDLPWQRVFQKDLYFETRAYAYNQNWEKEATDPFGPGG